MIPHAMRVLKKYILSRLEILKVRTSLGTLCRLILFGGIARVLYVKFLHNHCKGFIFSLPWTSWTKEFQVIGFIFGHRQTDLWQCLNKFVHHDAFFLLFLLLVGGQASPNCYGLMHWGRPWIFALSYGFTQAYPTDLEFFEFCKMTDDIDLVTHNFMH